MSPGEISVLAADEAMQKRRAAVADPLRMRILGLLSESDGLTAKELAVRLAMDPNRLYYHLRILEEAGVIGVVDTRASGRMAERVYKEIYAGRYIWDPADPVELSTYLGAGLEVTKLGAEEVLYEQARRFEAGDELPVVTWGHPSFVTSHEDIVEFTQRVDALQMEFWERASTRIAEQGGSVPDDWNTLKFSWVVFEQKRSERPAS